MAISKKIEGYMSKSSWIRKMFEQGEALRKQYGDGNVFDFTLGNPLPEPPEKVANTLRDLALRPPPGAHRYMSNAGYPGTRNAIAQALASELSMEFSANNVLMTCGAGGGLNVLLKALLDPGDEVIIIAPYFVEYLFYIDNHGGKAVTVNANSDFDLDVPAIANALTAQTKAVIICTPNNPTGVVYSQQTLTSLGIILAEHEQLHGTDVYLVSDEPYRKIVFDNKKCPSLFHSYHNSIMVTSHSKDLALPGERIGYVAISPNAKPQQALMDAMIFTNRTLGFVNAPATMQRVAEACQDVTVNIDFYQTKRDLLVAGLTGIGYQLVKPGGAFYLFPKCPIENDVEFINLALKKNVLLVPGSGFGTPGFFRIAYCTITDDMIERAMPAFKALYDECAR